MTQKSFDVGKNQMDDAKIKSHLMTVMIIAFLLAHSWFPPECCSGQDCTLLPATRVQESDGSYVIDGGVWKIPFNEARTSPDQNFHACITPTKKMQCFFAPRGAV